MSATASPKVSVIVPVYNIIPYLPRCVESLRTQTYENLEILLIDDGSTAVSYTHLTLPTTSRV